MKRKSSGNIANCYYTYSTFPQNISKRAAILKYLRFNRAGLEISKGVTYLVKLHRNCLWIFNYLPKLVEVDKSPQVNPIAIQSNELKMLFQLQFLNLLVPILSSSPYWNYIKLHLPFHTHIEQYKLKPYKFHG